MSKYTTYGAVRGMGPIRDSIYEACMDIDDDQDGCASQGGYSDRHICRIDADGYLICPATGCYITTSSGHGIKI